MIMDWQQKAEALSTLTELSVCCRKAGDWYVHQRLDVGGDGFLIGTYGNGTTPEEAIENHWSKLVEHLPSDRYLVVGYGEKRKHWCWVGFMWRELIQEGPR